MKLVAILAAAALLISGCASAFDARNNYTSNTAWAASQQARMVLAGVVVDTEGHPLRDVQATARYVWLRPTLQDLPRALTMHDVRSEEIDEHFHFVFSYAKQVQLQFHKRGYEDRTLDFTLKPAPGGDDSLGRYLKAIPMTEENLRVVMKPITSTAPASQP